MSRAPEDDIGRCIDAAEALYQQVVTRAAELQSIAHDRDEVSLGALLHLVVVTWIDKLADEGLTDRESIESHAISEAMANIEGRANAIRDARARVAS